MIFLNNIPIYFQIVNDIKRKIIKKELLENDKIPSIRLLCTEYEVTSLTMQRVMSELEREGIITIKKGVGSYINSGIYIKLNKQITKEIISKYISEMKNIGYNNDEIVNIVKEELKNE